ncbi:MAG: hypothetical protein HYT36_02740 [Candidatus Staskawiczbacteria bacterium]|nr:hypothetical protein [Candidatus Staskawiczbacteria bacterium]
MKDKHYHQPSSDNVPNAYWNRDNRQANLNRNDVDNRNDNCGVRSAMRVYEFTDFNQPPSILPVSASFAWIWNILVSLARSSSRNSRNFKVEISMWLEAYLRYGDDFIVISENLKKLKETRDTAIRFLEDNLLLKINSKSDIIVKAKWGLKFLGVKIYPGGRHLNNRNLQRIHDRISLKNVSSYAGLLKKHSNDRKVKYFNWLLLEKFSNYIN